LKLCGWSEIGKQEKGIFLSDYEFKKKPDLKKLKPDERTIKKQLSLAQNQAIGLAAGCGAARTPVS